MDLLHEVWVQWGVMGIVFVSALYIIWENIRRNKEIQEYYIRSQGDTDKLDDNNTILHELWMVVDQLSAKVAVIEEKVTTKLAELDQKIDKSHPAHIDEETKRFEGTMHVAPTIHTILNNYVTDCRADHILLAMLHNGTKSLTGMSYFKFDIVAEKFFPVTNPQDEEMAPRYKDVDITLHNRLPAAVIQNKGIMFDLTHEECDLETIDEIIYVRCRARGIKYIAFISIRDNNGVVVGFICAYSFNDSLDMEQLSEAAKTLEQLYCNMMNSFYNHIIE